MHGWGTKRASTLRLLASILWGYNSTSLFGQPGVGAAGITPVSRAHARASIFTPPWRGERRAIASQDAAIVRAMTSSRRKWSPIVRLWEDGPRGGSWRDGTTERGRKERKEKLGKVRRARPEETPSLGMSSGHDALERIRAYCQMRGKSASVRVVRDGSRMRDVSEKR